MRISVQYSSGRNSDGRLYVRTGGTVLYYTVQYIQDV
jgi:hypothetical protein